MIISITQKIIWTFLFKKSKKKPHSAIKNGFLQLLFQLRNVQVNFLLLLCLIFFLSACHTTGHLDLKEDEMLLRKNIVKFKSDKKVDDASNLEYQLLNQIRPQPNGLALVFFAEERVYNWDKEWLNRKGAPPSIYRESIAEESERRLEDYLFDRGYFNAKVNHTVSPRKLNKKKANATYIVELGKRSYINSIEYRMVDTSDQKAQMILNDLEEESLLQKGNPIDNLLFEEEKSRIDKTMKNTGYANFSRNYMPGLKVDSTNSKMRVFLDVLPPPDTTAHRIFNVGEIYIYDNFNIADIGSYARDTIINGIHFLSKTGDPSVDYQTILDNIFIKTGQLYQLDDVEKTLTQLRNLRVFRFVNRKETVNADNPNVIDIQIQLTLDKTMSIGYDLELNTSVSNNNINTSSRALFGTAASASFQKRNLFKKAHTLNLSLEAGVEIDPRARTDSSRQIINSVYIRGQGSYLFPKFYDYFKFWRLFHRVRNGFSKDIKPNSYYADLREKGKTRISTSVDWQNQINFLQITSFNLSYGFDFQRTPNTRFSANHAGIDYLFPDTIPQINSLFERSLGNQLFTAFILKNFSVFHKTQPTKRNSFYEFRSNMEFSGWEVYFANQVYNWLSPNDKVFRIENNDIDFSKFVRLEVDARYRRQFTPRQAIALRAASGIAASPDSIGVPYVKQFFVGGPNSIRAWQLRQLGPGSYFDTVADTSSTIPHFQAGDFKFEFNAEYRFPIVGYFDGAVFLDGGNIWTLKDDPERPGSKLSKNFFKEIALGTGFGLRFNYSLFLIRLDLGLKLRTNRPGEDGSHWVIDEWGKGKLGEWINPNFGIDYPF